MKTTRRLSPDRKLYKNLFLNHSPEETFRLLSEGILSSVANAERLYNDAQLLFTQGSWTSGRFLLSTANEEIAKPYIFLDACRLDFAKHQSNLIRLCYAFYDHTYKYAYNTVHHNPNLKVMSDVKDEWLESVDRLIPFSESEDTVSIHETYFLREMPLYIDFIDHDQRWSTPNEDLAEYNYSMGVGILDTKSTLDRLRKTRQSGLFSPTALNLINENFKKHYISDSTTDETLANLHKKTAQHIETGIGVSAETYHHSSLNTVPLYHFLTM